MAWFRQLLTKNVAKTVEEVVEPAKETVKSTIESMKHVAGDKVDLYSKILILGIEAIVGYWLLSESHKDRDRNLEEKGALPGTIIINNYISTGKKEENNNESN